MGCALELAIERVGPGKMEGVLLLIFIFTILALNSPIAKAVAARIRRDTATLQPMTDDRLTDQSARLEALETEVARLTEALEFTQRRDNTVCWYDESSSRGSFLALRTEATAVSRQPLSGAAQPQRV
jgi:hypothetical protein